MKHFNATHGMTNTPEYEAYTHAKGRCNNPTDVSWKHYGGRGIEFLFTSFEQFFSELGYRPEGKTLDRIDNDGHYEVGNVRWATSSEQMANRRKYKLSAVSCAARSARQLGKTHNLHPLKHLAGIYKDNKQAGKFRVSVRRTFIGSGLTYDEAVALRLAAETAEMGG